MSEKPVKVMISKAPDDPELKKKWVSEMMSIQIGLWLGDGATCLFCKHKYESIDDFTKRSPVRGHTDEMSFVCKDCYIPYKAILEITPEQLTKVTEGSGMIELIDWSTEPPTITEDGIKYKLWDGGSLSIVTPKSLMKLCSRLTKEAERQ